MELVSSDLGPLLAVAGLGRLDDNRDLARLIGDSAHDRNRCRCPSQHRELQDQALYEHLHKPLPEYSALAADVPLVLRCSELLPDAIGTWLKRDLPHSEVVTAILALGLFTASRIAVQVSAGILALPPGQRMASKAAGFSTAQAYRFVLLPQAFRLIVPPLTSEFLTIFKNSSIAMTIGVFELTAQTQQIESFTYQGFETFTAATVIYISIALIVTMLMRQVERRTAIPGTI